MVAIPGGEQVVSWGDFLFAGAAFWLPSAAFLGLERARSDRSPTATIKSIRRMMAAIAIATVIGAGIYLAARPPNFPVSTPFLAGFFSILLIGGHQLVQLISSGRLAAEANHHPWLSKFSLLVLGSFVSILLFEGLLHIYNPIECSVRGKDVVLPTNKRVILDPPEGRCIRWWFPDSRLKLSDFTGFRWGLRTRRSISKHVLW